MKRIRNFSLFLILLYKMFLVNFSNAEDSSLIIKPQITKDEILHNYENLILEDNVLEEKIELLKNNLVNYANLNIDPNDIIVKIANIESPKITGSGLLLFPKNLAESLENEEITCILAHELAHFENKHSLYSNFFEKNLYKTNSDNYNKENYKISQGFELQADISATVYLSKMGYDFSIILNTYQKLSEKFPNTQKEFSTHPSWSERLKSIEIQINEIKKSTDIFQQANNSFESDNYEKAIENFEILKKTYFENSPEILNNLGLSYYKLFIRDHKQDLIPSTINIRNFSISRSTSKELSYLTKAKENFQKIVDNYENNSKIINKSYLKEKKLLDKYLVIAYNNLALCLIIEKKYSDAEDLLNKAIKLEPDFASTYNNLGILFYEKTDYEKALVSFKKSSELSKYWTYPKYNLSMVYIKQNKKEQALILLNELVYKKSLSKIISEKNKEFNLDMIIIYNKTNLDDSFYGLKLLDNLDDSKEILKKNKLKYLTLISSENNKNTFYKKTKSAFNFDENDFLTRIFIDSKNKNATEKGLKIGLDKNDVLKIYGEPEEIVPNYNNNENYIYNLDYGIIDILFSENKVIFIKFLAN